MNRLQKKCFIATAGFHLLLLVILFVGPAFFSPKPKVDDSQVLDVIPANLIDAAFSSGVKRATPPPPTPVVTPPQPVPPPVITPPAPKPVVQPPPTPAPTFVERVETFFKPEPVKPAKPEPTPVVKPAADKPKIKVNLTPTVRTVPNTTANTAKPPKPDNSEKPARAYVPDVSGLRKGLSPSTKIDMPGNGEVAYAGYNQSVLSIYDAAWISPEGMATDEAVVKVRVTISRDGTVVSAEITEPSGDSKVDRSVQQTLNRVQRVRPFPEGAKDEQRTIEFNFRSKAKPLLG
jgi:protein TonB